MNRIIDSPRVYFVRRPRNGSGHWHRSRRVGPSIQVRGVPSATAPALIERIRRVQRLDKAKQVESGLGVPLEDCSRGGSSSVPSVRGVCVVSLPRLRSHIALSLASTNIVNSTCQLGAPYIARVALHLRDLADCPIPWHFAMVPQNARDRANLQDCRRMPGSLCFANDCRNVFDVLPRA